MYDDLLNRIKPFLLKDPNKQRSLDDLKTYLDDPKTRNFDKYLIKVFKSKKIKTISILNLYQALKDFYRTLMDNFNKLTRGWIKRPLVRIYSQIINDASYKTLLGSISSFLHYPDNEHVALAVHEVSRRNTIRGIQNYDYRFFTDERKWAHNDLERIINISNFKLKKVEYDVQDSLKYNNTTKSFNKKRLKLNYIPGNLLN